jgi:prepilin-type N-terminal cleavage/methylation domain-containing protein
MSNSKPKKEQGFTLIEVFIAIAVLTFGILAVASMHISAIQGNSFAAHVTEGTTWAQDKLEELMALPYTHADLTAGNHGPQVELSSAWHYTITWNVADDSPEVNTKTVTVTVTCQDKGMTRQTDLTCVKTQL